ncbi:helix-turn-helix domain-containing protein [Alteromonas sp. KUL106]|uniref:helix-turn-helix domain-containing protein n=1 Tax=Alteromonas sp. KUL106 TaxID=2480799 RepID=UPI001914E7B2|nr:helix-turn-helix transcriptional regulator [Alteromonas sp. KUL106]
MQFGTKIAHIRRAKGLSQEKLAEMTELDRTYISSIERGKRNVSLINIVRVAKALNCPPSELFSELGDNIGQY